MAMTAQGMGFDKGADAMASSDSATQQEILELQWKDTEERRGDDKIYKYGIVRQ